MCCEDAIAPTRTRAQDQVTFRNLGSAINAYDGFVGTEIEVSNVKAYDLGGTVLWVGGLSNGKVHMTGVDTYNASGAGMSSCGWSGCAEQPSTYLLERNTIRQAPGTGWAGFEIHDTSPVKSSIVIRNNRISGEGSYPFGPVFTEGTRNAVISNNQITGSGPAAIYVGAWGGDDSGAMIKANNVQRWTVDAKPCSDECLGWPLTPIWLGAETGGNTVVGSGNPHTTVFDETDNPDTPEYDGRNILVGMNGRGAHIGQAIRDAMHARIAAKKLFMSKGPY